MRKTGASAVYASKRKRKKRNDGALGVLWKSVVDTSKEEEEIVIPFCYYYYNYIRGCLVRGTKD
jgi:hypothetical protein